MWYSSVWWVPCGQKGSWQRAELPEMQQRRTRRPHNEDGTGCKYSSLTHLKIKNAACPNKDIHSGKAHFARCPRNSYVGCPDVGGNHFGIPFAEAEGKRRHFEATPVLFRWMFMHPLFHGGGAHKIPYHLAMMSGRAGRTWQSRVPEPWTRGPRTRPLQPPKRPRGTSGVAKVRACFPPL